MEDPDALSKYEKKKALQAAKLTKEKISDTIKGRNFEDVST